MRYYLKRLLAVTLSAALLLTTLGAGECGGDNKARDIALAKDVVTACRSALPLVRELNPRAAIILERAIPIAEKVVLAIERSDSTDAVALLRELLPLINEVVAQFTGNVKVLTILALADIALHILINHYERPIAKARARQGGVRAQGASDPILEFKAKPIWGCIYRPDLCPVN